MQKRYLVMFVLLLVLGLAGTSYAWQGRMGGMGDPYGLVSDESDFLIHPAKIANGEGIKFYGHYRFTHTDVTNWDYDSDLFDATGALVIYSHFATSGYEQKHDALLGAAFPLGPGRMGLFFTYDGMRGAYDGDEAISGALPPITYDLHSDLDAFSLRLLYGLPLGAFKLGGETQLLYRQEENETWWQSGLVLGYLNWPLGGLNPTWNLLPFMFPYDSEYWEALFKGSLEGTIGPLETVFTLEGGFIFGGGNQLETEEHNPLGTLTEYFVLDGDVEGWHIGGDLWVRYPLSQDLSLPFLMRIDYQEKSRDGKGFTLTGNPLRYDNEEEGILIEVGGGVDTKLAKGLRIAAGIYYDYRDSTDSLCVLRYDNSDYPGHSEHQAIIRLAGEWEVTPSVALRMGLEPFFGWVKEDFEFWSPWITDSVSLDGYHWGIRASLGGTVQFPRFTLEPFCNAGYKALELDGDGERTGPLYKSDEVRREEWYIGGGLSVLFDVP